MDILIRIAELDAMTLTVLVFSVVLAALLFAVAESWRRAVREAPALPMWQSLDHEGLSRLQAEESAGSRAVRDAELRCTLCARRPACRQRVAAGGARLEPCPNERFFSELTNEGLPH